MLKSGTDWGWNTWRAVKITVRIYTVRTTVRPNMYGTGRQDQSQVPYEKRLTQHYICGPGVGEGRYSANAVEYGTLCKQYGTIKERYDTAFKNTATSNIATVAYGTSTVCNK